jgi:arylamine N-acetyltransferase
MKMENQFFCLEDESRTLYYDHNQKRWVSKDKYTGCWYPATFPCRSYSAAKRHLRTHDEIPKGMKFILVNRFIGFDRYLVKK